MPERCIDANIAIKWFIKGESFRLPANSINARFTMLPTPRLPNYEGVNFGRRTRFFTLRSSLH